MPKKKNEAGRTVVFFQTQPLEVARAVLDICRETVEARMPKVDKVVKTRKAKKGEGQLPLTSEKVS
jgi:hypothetical protein